jgi:hypothetical protein
MKGFADNKGNSYSVSNDGSSTKMHQDPDGKTFSEHIYKDGSRFRQIHDTNGNAKIYFRRILLEVKKGESFSLENIQKEKRITYEAR